jgi:transcriptional regulator with XRE-family HTH domain
MSLTLRACRVNKGLTQVEAAKALGIRKETLINYELGRTYPDVLVIKKMEQLYGVQYSDIKFFNE